MSNTQTRPRENEQGSALWNRPSIRAGTPPGRPVLVRDWIGALGRRQQRSRARHAFGQRGARFNRPTTCKRWYPRSIPGSGTNGTQSSTDSGQAKPGGMTADDDERSAVQLHAAPDDIGRSRETSAATDPMREHHHARILMAPASNAAEDRRDVEHGEQTGGDRRAREPLRLVDAGQVVACTPGAGDRLERRRLVAPLRKYRARSPAPRRSRVALEDPDEPIAPLETGAAESGPRERP